MKPKKKSETPAAPSSLDEPTTTQIATLAAALVRPGDKLDSPTLKKLAGLAVSLWNASELALRERTESKERLAQIRMLEAKIPRMPEWEGVEKSDRKPVSYDRGLEVLFQHHRSGLRDSIMLDFLNYLAKAEKEGASIARDNWRRMKQEGFHPGEFNRIAFHVPEWLRVRQTLVNTENAKLRKK